MWGTILELLISAIGWLFKSDKKTDAQFVNEQAETSLDAADVAKTDTERKLMENTANESESEKQLDALDPDVDDGFDRMSKSNEIARRAAGEANSCVRKN